MNFDYNNTYKDFKCWGRGCGKVCRARELRFKSRHCQFFNVNCIEKTKIKKKRLGKAQLFEDYIYASITTM